MIMEPETPKEAERKINPPLCLLCNQPIAGDDWKEVEHGMVHESCYEVMDDDTRDYDG
jgi:hypothetical protein